MWFDKCTTLIIFADGKLGMNLEHTAADAVVPCRMTCYISQYVYHVGDVGEQWGDDDSRIASAARGCVGGVVRTAV